MSLVAATDNLKSISTFARCCLALAAISSQICVSFTKSALYVLAVNSSRTTNGEITFPSTFFRDYLIMTESILSDGYDKTNDSYSFVVSAKLLVVLLRNLDSGHVNYIHLSVDCSESTAPSKRYKLNVEIFTKKQVLKKYQIGYQPAEFVPTDIPTRYLNLRGNVRINQFTLEVSTLKLFVDMTPSVSEEFGIDVKNNKIMLLAYSKQVVRDADYLKQAMLISVLMAINELPLSSLEDNLVGINFRLKDFRTYMNLVSTFRKDMRLSADYTDEEATIDTYFLQPGDPILFQFRDFGVSVNLIQITANDGEARQGEDQTEKLILKPARLKDQLMVESGNLESDLPTLEQLKATARDRGRDIELEADLTPEDEQLADLLMITYGNSHESGSESHRGKKRAREPDTFEEEADDLQFLEEPEFGPTQITDKPKALFD